MVCTQDARLTPLGRLANQGVTTIQRISDIRNSPLVRRNPFHTVALEVALRDDVYATIDDDDATIDDGDAAIDDGDVTIDDDDATIDDGDASDDACQRPHSARHRTIRPAGHTPPCRTSRHAPKPYTARTSIHIKWST